MDLLESLVFCFGLLGLIALGILAMGLWRSAPDGQVLLYQMLGRQGDDVARIALASGSRDFAVAVNQCLGCDSAARCRAWLDSDKREGFDAFCANAGYVSRLTLLAQEKKWTLS